jgi:hypothetical protein
LKGYSHPAAFTTKLEKSALKPADVGKCFVTQIKTLADFEFAIIVGLYIIKILGGELHLLLKAGEMSALIIVHPLRCLLTVFQSDVVHVRTEFCRDSVFGGETGRWVVNGIKSFVLN